MSYTLYTDEDILKKQRYIVKHRGSLYDIRDDMRNWCSEQFGPHSSSYKNPRWSEDWAAFYFKNESDMMLFMLKWG